MNAASQTEVAKERLIKDFKNVVADTEDLLRATASQTGEKVANVRARVEEGLAVTKKQLADLEEGLVEKSKAAARATDELVQEHPWKAVGVAAAVGFLLGMLTSRR
ncbi:MAG: DUF883 domain-containing protein [Gammaproteobacteria bacterium]|nr:DUF883 domain-containing protein [Gammaproteobacteria bacterium]